MFEVNKARKKDKSRKSKAPAKKKENDLQTFLLAHIDDILTFFGKKKTKLDLAFLSKIVNMQDKLEQIFPAERPDLGTKYRDIGTTLWTNDHLISVRNILVNEKL